MLDQQNILIVVVINCNYLSTSDSVTSKKQDFMKFLRFDIPVSHTCVP